MVRSNATGKHAAEEWAICHMQMYLCKKQLIMTLQLHETIKFLMQLIKVEYAPQQSCAKQCL